MEYGLLSISGVPDSVQSIKQSPGSCGALQNTSQALDLSKRVHHSDWDSGHYLNETHYEHASRQSNAATPITCSSAFDLSVRNLHKSPAEYIPDKLVLMNGDSNNIEIDCHNAQSSPSESLATEFFPISIKKFADIEERGCSFTSKS